MIDLDKVEVKIVPYLNPWGYDHRRRQNAQGSTSTARATTSGTLSSDAIATTTASGARRLRLEGTAPLPGEREPTGKSSTRPNFYCLLDFHGNTVPRAISWLFCRVRQTGQRVSRPRSPEIANRRPRGRHLLRQNNEDSVSQYLLDRVQVTNSRPVLMNTSGRDRYGLTIEVTAGYGSSYGTVLQTDVVCELCRALFIAYPPKNASSTSR